MNFRISSRVLLVCLALCTAMAVAQAPASIFQLDGNAGNDSQGCNYGSCDYWNLLNGAGGAGVVTQTQTPPTAAGNWSARTFINGASSTDSFTSGGSKDPNPISQWAWSGSPTPNKDTLNAGYAAGYNLSDFDVVFGANRASPNGDANIGIWFFQQTVLPVAGGKFSGAHTDHDIFVISAFTGGGGDSTISVYEWDHTCSSGVKNPTPGQCADANLRLLASPSQVCGSSDYCAVTNSTTTNTSWGGSLASPLFFEGGVDITAALATVGITQLPCFTSFLEETRSSQSTSSVLKDFLAGGFPVCGLSISKVCGTATIDPSGNFIDYPVTITVTNTGIGSLSGISVKDAVTYTAGSTNNTGTSLTLAVTPSTLGPNGQGTATTTLTSSAGSVSDQATVTDGTGTVTATSGVVTCSGSFQTTLNITKSCSTSLAVTASDVQVQVGFNGSVCNTGPSTVTGLALTDYQGSSTAGHAINNIGTTTLAPCTSAGGTLGCTAPASACTTYSGSYTPTSIDVTTPGGTGPGRAFFNDEAVITGATATVGTLTKVSSGPTDPGNGSYGEATASCPVCQGAGECTAQ